MPDGSLYVTDAEMYRRLGVPEQTLGPILPELEAKAGFPAKQKLFGGRRYWPAVVEWTARHNGTIEYERRFPSAKD